MDFHVLHQLSMEIHLKSEITKKVAVNFQKEGDFQYNLNPYFTTGKIILYSNPLGLSNNKGAFLFGNIGQLAPY